MQHESDTCFLALTRPAIRWGVPLEGLVLNLCLSFLVGAWFNHLAPMPAVWLCIALPTHCVMRLATAADYHWAKIFFLWAETKGRNLATEEWGGSSLSPLPTRWSSNAAELAVGV